MEKILLLQFTAHILADFFLQPEKWCLSKQKNGLRAPEMYYHFAIILLFSILFTFDTSFIIYAVGIAVAHLVIDICKSYIERKIIQKKRPALEENQMYSNPYLFVGDQLLHIVVIFIAVYIFMHHHAAPQYLSIIPTYYILIALSFLMCLKPANVLIRIFLSSLNLHVLQDESNENRLKKEDLERAGRWIGSIERTLTFVLVLLGEFTAIGFIIAAKSILRYNDKPLGKTEYVLIGTLMSFGIAVLIGLGVSRGVFMQVLNFVG